MLVVKILFDFVNGNRIAISISSEKDCYVFWIDFVVIAQVSYLLDESCGGVWVLLSHGGCFVFWVVSFNTEHLVEMAFSCSLGGGGGVCKTFQLLF